MKSEMIRKTLEPGSFPDGNYTRFVRVKRAYRLKRPAIIARART